MKRNNIKLRINPKIIETKVGTLACPEAFDPRNMFAGEKMHQTLKILDAKIRNGKKAKNKSRNELKDENA